MLKRLTGKTLFFLLPLGRSSYLIDDFMKIYARMTFLNEMSRRARFS